jgi:pimeloyl-ACP methyl ester carboxylesterase
VCCNGLGVSTFFFKYLTDYFRHSLRLLTWDYRGHGHSSCPPEPFSQADLSIERSCADLESVLEAAGVRGPIVLVGHSMGCQVSLEFTVRHRDRVVGLIPMFGTPGRPLDCLLNSSKSRDVVRWVHRTTTWGGRRASRLWLTLVASPLAYPLSGLTGLIDPYYARRDDISEYLDHLATLDPRLFLRMAELIADHDAEPHLGSIDCPALVIASENDRFTPLYRSTIMAEKLPNSELMVLAEATHAAIVEHPETINLRIARFLRERLNVAV